VPAIVVVIVVVVNADKKQQQPASQRKICFHKSLNDAWERVWQTLRGAEGVSVGERVREREGSIRHELGNQTQQIKLLIPFSSFARSFALPDQE